ncbi:MAG TPA: LPS export ABC transporter ATP-binding protein [Elusimicrobia bacterium]|nr:MAG: LPS export ABC transporter ATP-binding protein [Elusimicrobia bacterium RIFOXYA12_FULL_49_49]OGS09675.1 MAG: LPS export ABC transporter ATP-binding protein [Elusimicrobia bacterium RIFOXYB1_FULL_48_9]OGS15564.1 MAG: LPS export ABC transporter ATP-binding protein [Elusimicrobia bacterium RIFOXYA2_FULL_47_53]OGS26880.1 MAG: LPS export ABC transporter ATP-binding protein [Elusimicrobia bacterium RIFOXYB12_FULL_50_12]OGS30663.1 MAG: LPS export ABC transporter ATP-binding protein [Elusimicro
MILRSAELKKKYKQRTVVNGVSIEVKQGEIVGLLGPNGAGKTTTFYMTVGLIKPFSGDVLLDDKVITGLPMYMRARAGIGYLSQEPSIFRRLTVQDNLWAVLETLDIPMAEKEAKAKRLLSELGLEHLKDQYAMTLSGGEKRRCEIARALVTDPKFLLLDEPFVGIDPITVSDIQGIIARLRDSGLGILITDHNVRETLEIIDRAYIIYEGRILLEGKARDLLNSPEAKRVYLGENFKMHLD